MGLCTSSIHSEYLGTTSLCSLLISTVKTYRAVQLSAKMVKNERGDRDLTYFSASCPFPCLANGSKIAKSSPVTIGRLFFSGVLSELTLLIFMFQCFGGFLQYLGVPDGMLC